MKQVQMIVQPEGCDALLAARANYDDARLAWKQDPDDDELIRAYGEAVNALADIALNMAMAVQKIIDEQTTLN